MLYDIAIIGGGPAGVSAAINAKILNKNFIWFSRILCFMLEIFIRANHGNSFAFIKISVASCAIAHPASKKFLFAVYGLDLAEKLNKMN